ncbi:MAG: ABC transporter ATP-binding protein [Planctomycetota bacterium]
MSGGSDIHPTDVPTLRSVKTDDSILEVSNVSKCFGRAPLAVNAVVGIDLRLSAGELVAIVGASGSGKTTLLHLIAGLERPDSGMIQVCGKSIYPAREAVVNQIRMNCIGMVFQAQNLLPTLNAEDNVALALQLAGVRRNEALTTARQRLEDLGMADHLRNRPAQLSGGQQQRVAIARALATSAPVILADEPTGSLDRVNSESVTAIFRDVVRDGNRAVAIVTHDPMVASQADRVVVLADGSVADQFTRDDFTSAEELTLRILRGTL